MPTMNFVAALGATAVALGLIGCLLAAIVERDERPAVLTATALGALVLVPVIALQFIHMTWLAPMLERNVQLVLWLLMGPVTEEPAKWLVLLFLLRRGALEPRNAGVIALGLGLGFAIVEVWSQNFFGGLPTDAVSVVSYVIMGVGKPIAHAGFVLFVAVELAAGRPIWRAALLGMALHLVNNVCASVTLIGVSGPIFTTWEIVRLMVPRLMVFYLAWRLLRAAGIDVAALMIRGRLVRSRAV